MFKMKEHFSKIVPLVIFFLGKGISDVSILFMIPLPFAKSCEVDERTRGQNLFDGLGEEKPELSQWSKLNTTASTRPPGRVDPESRGAAVEPPWRRPRARDSLALSEAQSRP